MAVIEFSSQNNGIDVQFYSKGDKATSRVVGVEGGRNRLVRYTFTTPGEGALAVSLQFYCDGDRTGSSNVPLRFYIGTDPTSHANAGPDSEYHGTLTKTTSKDGAVLTGELDILLLPNTVYYLWIFPGISPSGNYGYYSWFPPLDSGLINTLTLSGGAGLVLINRVVYQAYIEDGSQYSLYLAFVDNGDDWDLLCASPEDQVIVPSLTLRTSDGSVLTALGGIYIKAWGGS